MTRGAGSIDSRSDWERSKEAWSLVLFPIWIIPYFLYLLVKEAAVLLIFPPIKKLWEIIK